MASNQIFKAVYFSDYKETNPKARGVVLAFGERNIDLYKSVADLGSNELRNLLGTDSYLELEQRAQQEGLPINTYCLWYLRKNIGVEETKTKLIRSSEGPISNFINQVVKGESTLEPLRTYYKKQRRYSSHRARALYSEPHVI
ncbi:MAG: hypothetical protein US98_C0009G0002 [Parcubacteria group bacterium GW2011_GWC1_38_6]|nr:MAG: hypothetical protein US98_C0009G0002 [Parcubacteria group bacterium GW2011_GWC1_38_6]